MMNSQSSISVPIFRNKERSSQWPIGKLISDMIKEFISKFADYHVKKQDIYYVSSAEYIAERSIHDFATLSALKSDWSYNDVVRLRRGVIYQDDGTYKKLLDAGVFIEAYGQGDHPIIKTGNTYVEVLSTEWM